MKHHNASARLLSGWKPYKDFKFADGSLFMAEGDEGIRPGGAAGWKEASG
jgi:hypothetical protein